MVKIINAHNKIHDVSVGLRSYAEGISSLRGGNSFSPVEYVENGDLSISITKKKNSKKSWVKNQLDRW